MRLPRASLTIPALILSAGLMTVAAAIALGPLNPPSGAVSPTNKTLAEVEPRIAINATNTPGDGSAIFKITQPGSYYLTGNVTGVAAKNGIVVQAPDVTIDFNGFELVGVPGSLSAVSVSLAQVVTAPRLTAVNGTIRAWDQGAFLVGTSTVLACRYENLHVIGTGPTSGGLNAGPGAIIANCSVRNCSTGIDTAANPTNGPGSTVINCLVSDCVTGMDIRPSSTVTGCTAKAISGVGIIVGQNSTVSNCTARQCSGTGIVVDARSTISDCTASVGSAGGFNIGSQSTMTNCSAASNAGIGISMNGFDGKIDACSVSGNGSGIAAGLNVVITNSTISNSSVGSGIIITNAEGVRVQDCTISGHTGFGITCDTLSNTSDLAIVNCVIRLNGSGGISAENNTQVIACNVNNNGASTPGPGIKVGDGSSIIDTAANNNAAGGIVAGAGATVSRCTAYQNTGNGISVGGSSSILDSIARLNTLDGILFSFRCQVRGNNSASNTLAQFHATNTDNRIEANIAVSGAIGFNVDLSGNLLTRNSSTNATTNWDVVAGNVCLVINAATSAAISGNAGGTAPGSTDPNANFSY